jgi:branched-chain amino acid transport system substrate-binding protein
VICATPFPETIRGLIYMTFNYDNDVSMEASRYRGEFKVMKKSSFVPTFMAIACLGLAGPLIAQSYGVSPEKIVVHHIGPLKNAVLAASNQETLDATDVYLAKVNQGGGINGRKIVMERHDDGQDPKKTAEIVATLASEKSGIAFVLPRTTPGAEAIMPVAEANGIPLIGPQPGSASLTTPFKRTVFTVRASYGDEVNKALELQHALGRSRFGFVIANDAFGNDVLKVATEKLASLNLKPIVVGRVDNRTADISAALTAFAAAKPEVVLLICNAKSGAEFVKAHSAVGGFVQFIAISNSSNTGFIKDLGEARRGVVVMQVIPSPEVVSSNLVSEFNTAMKAAKKPISYNAFQGYITGMVITEGIRRAGKNPTPSNLISALESITSWDLGGFIISYGKDNRVGSKFVEPTMITKDGRFM